MAIRVTIIRPLPGRREEALETLEALDQALAGRPGLLESSVLSDAGVPGSGLVGRISQWVSRERADQEAQDPRVLALRARLMGVTAERSVDTLFDVESAASGLPREPAGLLFPAA